jgi:hypothetical protein
MAVLDQLPVVEAIEVKISRDSYQQGLEAIGLAATGLEATGLEATGLETDGSG